ncbi:MAG: DEAD/DEAH box helicase [Spirochaetaceae bacterium]|jgi:superfamily II DNA/RNA helicase|nr:DEAD/DEAH box helicase [Spirochaetaceae bacterium]
MPSFADLGIDPVFIEKLARRNITGPTKIQEMVIPALSAGKSLLFRSATGTGKTFAYLIPLFQAPASGESRPEILICAPTYELCAQIKGEAGFLLEGGPRRVDLVIGSVPLGRQIEGLKKNKPAVIVGNPGRVLLLARMGKLNLGAVRFLVLDEGDRLVSDEMYGETRDLAALLNQNRLTAACSATLSPRSRERLLPLAGGAEFIEETGVGDVYRTNIEHWAFFSDDRRKIRTLRSFLHAAKVRKALVFTARGGQVGNILSQLQFHQIAAAGLYGDLDRGNRKQALDDFRADRVRVLVSSDLAARGLDIAGLSHVIALDVPPGGEAYIHRSGRTGRAGRRGFMVTIGNAEELPRLAAIEKKLGIVVYPKVLHGGIIAAPEIAGDGETGRFN